MHYIIYKTTNNINGKYYIGKHKTKDLDDGYLGSGKLLKRALKKYGKENFTKVILLECSDEQQMNLAERIMVVPDPTNYNLCDGGKGGWSYVNKEKLSPNFAWKFINDGSEKHKLRSAKGGKTKYKRYGVPHLQKFLDAAKISMLGKHHTPDTKVKMSLSHQGKHQGSKNSQYGTMWITNGIQNKKIPKNDLDKWVNQGYTKGRKMNLNARMAKLG